jgi:hypothetical protein
MADMENPQQDMQIRESNTGQMPKYRQKKIFFSAISYKVACKVPHSHFVEILGMETMVA